VAAPAGWWRPGRASGTRARPAAPAPRSARRSCSPAGAAPGRRSCGGGAGCLACGGRGRARASGRGEMRGRAVGETKVRKRVVFSPSPSQTDEQKKIGAGGRQKTRGLTRPPSRSPTHVHHACAYYSVRSTRPCWLNRTVFECRGETKRRRRARRPPPPPPPPPPRPPPHHRPPPRPPRPAPSSTDTRAWTRRRPASACCGPWAGRRATAW
jgi:hypothetical protein